MLVGLIEKILLHGHDHNTRAGMCRTLTHQTLTFDLSQGFPRMTERFVPFKSVAVELEGFIGGITDKRWYQDRGCKFWDEWGTGNSLGLIYGWQWRRFNESRLSPNSTKLDYLEDNKDQLAKVLRTLRLNPNDRRMRVSSVNPLQEQQMALPACHDYWDVHVIGGQLDLFFHMRSWDVYLGGPANIQSYAMLNHLLAQHAGVRPGKVTVLASNAHLYHNLIPQAVELIRREAHRLPEVEFTHDFFDDWDHTKINCVGYKHSGKLSGDVSV